MNEEVDNTRNTVVATLAVELARSAASNPNFDVMRDSSEQFAASCIAHACAVVDQSNEIANFESTNAH